MKIYYFFTMFVFSTILLFSQKERTLADCPYDVDIYTHQFIILDINYEKKLVAFKHIYEQQVFTYSDENGEVQEKPINCSYPGMEQYPNSGVILGVYDLEKQEYLKIFTIYKSCFQKKDCYDFQYSAKMLDSAKSYFNSLNLDITKKPTPYNFSNKDNKEFNLSLYGISFKANYKSDYDNFLTVSYLFANNKLIYQINQEENFVMGSHGEIYYISAYSDGTHIIFLNKLFHDVRMEGPISYEFFHFSPVFKISDFKNN